MFTIRATVFLGRGETYTVFVKDKNDEIDKLKFYKAYFVNLSEEKVVQGVELINPEIILHS